MNPVSLLRMCSIICLYLVSLGVTVQMTPHEASACLSMKPRFRYFFFGYLGCMPSKVKIRDRSNAQILHLCGALQRLILHVDPIRGSQALLKVSKKHFPALKFSLFLCLHSTTLSTSLCSPQWSTI